MGEKKTVGQTIKTIVIRFLAMLLTTLLLVVAGLIGMICVFNYGPSPSARSIFMTSMLETSALKFVAKVFVPTDELEEILENNSLGQIDEVTNPDLVVIDEGEGQGEPIEIVECNGMTYTGRMMIVKDPSRVKVGTCQNFGISGKSGEHVYDMAERYEATAAVNGGGFEDTGGMGKGSVPIGFVIENGEFKYGPMGKETILIGFDQNNKLIVGNMTGKQAIDMGIRDGLSFGPALIVNGQAADVSGVSSGLNPRTAIGQREDGAVLILVVDGRQARSLGCSYGDLIDIMLEFGAVNAGNLDGGSSSLMYYNGEVISTEADLTGDRPIPTCFYVK